MNSSKMSIVARHDSGVEVNHRQACPDVDDGKRNQQKMKTSSSALGFAARKSSTLEAARR